MRSIYIYTHTARQEENPAESEEPDYDGEDDWDDERDG